MVTCELMVQKAKQCFFSNFHKRKHRHLFDTTKKLQKSAKKGKFSNSSWRSSIKNVKEK